MSLDQLRAFVKPNDVSCDKFLGDSLKILQPKKGFRAGIDSVLLGASVGASRKNLIDLGSGVGVAGLCALNYRKNLKSLFLEKNPEMLVLAKENILINSFEKRADIIELDLTLSGNEREAAGLKINHFDCVIANPPFFDANGGTLAKGEARSTARHMAKEDLGKWVRTAASCAAPKGEVIFIFPIIGLLDLLNQLEGRFGDLTILPITSRIGQNASRFLVRGIKGSKAPLNMRSPLILHGEKGNEYLPEIEAIFRGEKPLLW